MLKRLNKEDLRITGLILFLIVLAYGLLIPDLGFYWDDWPFAWFLRFFGPGEFIASFRPFRPLLGPVFAATTTMFGGDPLVWQGIGLAARFILAFQVWLLLKQVWPSQHKNVLWVTLLFTLHPAYLQQWVALTHVNQELIPLMFLLASFIVTVHALRNGFVSSRWTPLALVLQFLGLFTTEYFFGLEILRFFFLLAIVSETIKAPADVLKKTLKLWLPYLTIWIINAVWTYAYHRSAAYDSYEISVGASALFTPAALLSELINTFSLSGFISWLTPFSLFTMLDGSMTQLAAFGIFVPAAAAVFIVMRSHSEADEAADNSWAKWAMAMGGIAIFAGRLPSWAAGLPLKIQFDYDRFFVSIMAGASLFIIGFLVFFIKSGLRRTAFLSLLIGLSAAYQFTVMNTYRRDAAVQRDFLWQMAWRMPSLKPGTALLTYELPFKYVADLQVTAPVNWMYAPAIEDRQLPYVLMYIKTRLGSEALPTLKPDRPIHLQYRTVDFDGNTSNSVVLYKDADGCLRVLDPLYANAQTVPGAVDLLLNAIPLSNPQLIQADTAPPIMDETLFGAEPEHGWCFFYAKAELARQQGDWALVTQLRQQAQKADLDPLVPVENLPFIEAYAQTGQQEAALKLSGQTLKAQPDLCPAVYSIWDRVLPSSAEIQSKLQEYGCER